MGDSVKPMLHRARSWFRRTVEASKLLGPPRQTASAHLTPSDKRAIPEHTRRQLLHLSGADNWHGALYVTLDWAIIGVAVATAMLWKSIFVYLLAVLIIGSRHRAMMNLLHQGSHNLLFKQRRLNAFVSNVFLGLPLLSTHASYTTEHLEHHKHTWNDELDPKTKRYRQLLLVAPQNLAEFCVRHIVKPVLLLHMPFNVWSALRKKGDTRKDIATRLSFWAAAVMVISYAGIWEEFFLYWVIPYISSFQIIRYFGEMAEHAGLQTTNAWLGTRAWSSVLPVRWLIAPHNDEMHLTHHLFPRIPHYRIKRAHDLLMHVPEYANAHHCYGLFWPGRAGAPSVMQDILESGRARMSGLAFETDKAA